MADTVKLPTSELGSVLPPRPQIAGTGTVPAWSVIEAQSWERLPVAALRWPQSIRTFEDMRRDSQIQGLLQSVFLPIRHMQWYVDPTGTTGNVATEIAEDFGLPLLGDTADPEDGAGIDFDDHLRMALLALALGHSFFEESGELDDGRYRLRRLETRPPTSIQRINVLPNGDLHSIWQHGMPVVEIPADRLLSYVWDREGANWAGRPLLYGIYRNWLLKDQLVRSDAVKHTRFNGIPVVETTDQSVGKESHEKAAEMAMRVQAGDGAGAATPFGTRLRLLGVEGTLPDTIGSINYHDQQMARAFMQMFAELGNTQHGSRALGTTLMDHYALGVLAIAHWTRRSLMQLVRRIAVRNYGPDVIVPKVLFRQDDHEDITAQDLVALIDSGAIVVDDELEATVRERSNLPPRDMAEPGRVPPAKQLPAPAATAAARRDRRPVAATVADSPADAAQTDFAGLQHQFEVTLAAMTAVWGVQRQAVIDSLVAQVAAAKTTQDLAAIAASAPTADHLAAQLNAIISHGADSAMQEAAAQGATLPAPDLAATQGLIAGAAAATMTALTAALTLSAISTALRSDGPNVKPADIASTVRDHLEGLAGANADYELAGLATKAQNAGRFAAMQGAPDGTRFYASELNDSNTCEACADEDGTEFASLDDAMADYPSGFAGCEGGNRCRGTAVAVYGETTPSL